MFITVHDQKQHKCSHIEILCRGAWVVQLIKRPTSDQVMISQFMGSSTELGSPLIAQSLEPPLDSVLLSVCLSLSVFPPPQLVHACALSLSKINKHKEKKREREKKRGTWVTQSAKHPTSAQVMISRLVSLSPLLGSVLTAQSLKPASDSVSVSLCPTPTHAFSLSQI